MFLACVILAGPLVWCTCEGNAARVAYAQAPARDTTTVPKCAAIIFSQRSDSTFLEVRCVKGYLPTLPLGQK